jgi:hypothetical protein
MNRRPRALSLALLLGGAGASLSTSRAARAADPTAADCLAGVDASLRSETEHRLRAERAQLLLCASPACPRDIRKECTRRVDEVSGNIPTIVFEATDAAGHDLTTVTVTMDGEVIAERLDGTALPVDPGPHLFRFETPGQAPVQRQLILREGQRDRHESVALAASGNAGANGSSSSGGAGTGSMSSGSVQTGLAVVATVVGAAGLGAGVVFGLQAVTKRNDAEKACPSLCADENGVVAWRDARAAADVATVAFATGGVALLGATALWLAGRPRGGGAPTAEVALGIGGIGLRARW